MTVFHPYLHVERLGTDECEGLLESGHVYVTAKIDGTNACAWFDGETGEMQGGSRKRALSPDNDNAGFLAWLRGDSEQATALGRFLAKHPSLVVYGEWMGGLGKFIGQIKDYDSTALSHLFIFDVFDSENKCYLPEQMWRALVSNYPPLGEFCVEILARANRPSIEQIAEIANSNAFLLGNANHVGEGVVVKADGFRNKFGREVRGKLVLDEYKQMKKASKKVNPIPGEVEKEIVDRFLTDAELSKTLEKVCLATESDRFDASSAKMVGMFVSLCWNDLLSECPNWAKKMKNPVVDFGALKADCARKSRAFVGLD